MFRFFTYIFLTAISIGQFSCTKQDIDTSKQQITPRVDVDYDDVYGSWTFEEKCINLNEDRTYTLDFEGNVNISSKGTWDIIDDKSLFSLKSIIFYSESDGVEDKTMAVTGKSETQLDLELKVIVSNDIGSDIRTEYVRRTYTRK